jgi:hypothetical protein
MKLSRSIILVFVSLLLTFSAVAQTGKTAKDLFDQWKEQNPVKTDKRNFWAMAAIGERTDGGAKVSFYITAAFEVGKFGATEIIVQPVFSDHDENVPREPPMLERPSVFAFQPSLLPKARPMNAPLSRR